MANKEGSFKLIGIVMVVSLLIAALWDQIPWLKNFIHAILNPTAGFLIDWNLTAGMLVIVFVISLLTTFIQKYATDQKALKELKKEQKIIQEEMKKFKDHPEKVMELQKKQLEFIPKTMKLSTRALAYTGIPFILFFRWFNDYFIAAGNPLFLGFMGWFIFYLITTLIFSGVLKKWMDVV
ncbi:MAG: EMC3/TMCO1 family protein [archaeon]|nr:EMC3/TMCO1 family protein [archaeon]